MLDTIVENHETVFRHYRLSDQADAHMRQITSHRGNLRNAIIATLSSIDLLHVELVTVRTGQKTTVNLPKLLDDKLTNAAKTRGCSKNSLMNGAILAFNVLSLK